MRGATHTLLLVRNGVSHDARVLRAARVAQRTLGGGTLVVGAATAAVPAGAATVEGVRVVRLRARGRAPGARLRRRLSGASFAWQALRLARRERPRVVHANDWNTMWCGVAIKLTCGARLIYDSHELWPDRNGRWERRWWLLASEALFVRVADAVMTASPGYAEVLARRYGIERPTVVRNIPEIPLPSEPPLPAQDFPDAEAHLPAEAPALRTPKPQAPALAVYVGGLMRGRGLEQAIDALALAPSMRLRAIGPGAEEYRASLRARAAAAGVAERVELLPAVPPAEVPSALKGATAGLCLIQPVCRSYELTLPNKLFEYAAAGVPVLASEMPVIAAVVRGEGLGEVVDGENPCAVAAGLERLAEPARWSEAARRSHSWARANDWRGESRVLAGIYGRVLARGAPARGQEYAAAGEPV